MCAIIDLLFMVLRFYLYIVIASVIFSWLFAFNIINTQNQFVAMVANFLHQMTEPVLSRIRRVLPDLGAIDISPIVLLFGVYFLEIVILRYVYAPMNCAIF